MRIFSQQFVFSYDSHARLAHYKIRHCQSAFLPSQNASRKQILIQKLRSLPRHIPFRLLVRAARINLLTAILLACKPRPRARGGGEQQSADTGQLYPPTIDAMHACMHRIAHPLYSSMRACIFIRETARRGALRI